MGIPEIAGACDPPQSLQDFKWGIADAFVKLMSGSMFQLVQSDIQTKIQMYIAADGEKLSTSNTCILVKLVIFLL